MCGRYELGRPFRILKREMKAGGEGKWEGHFNVAPTMKVPVLVETASGPELREMVWGFIPPWSPEPKASFTTINARAETVATLRTYAKAFKTSRCIVPADAFYEWTHNPEDPKGRKLPYRFSPLEGGFHFAGLWTTWRPKGGGEAVDSFTIITTAANEVVAPIHNRMPVVLGSNKIGPWMSAETPERDLQGFLGSYPASLMQAERETRDLVIKRRPKEPPPDALDSL